MLNLCPGPPLDGFGAIRSLITEDVQANLNRFSGIGLLLFWMSPVGGIIFKYSGQLASFFSAMWMAPFQFLS